MWMCLERERGDGGPVYEWNDLYRTKDAKNQIQLFHVPESNMLMRITLLFR